MTDNISEKDKKVWEKFISSKEKLHNKDIKFKEKISPKIKSIDLHGYTLEQANKSIDSGKKRTKNLVNKVEKMRTIGGLEPTKDISDKLRIIDKE